MLIESVIRKVVRDEMEAILKERDDLLNQRANDLLTRDQVINDYFDKGITSYYKITDLEQNKGLKRHRDKRPMLFRRQDVENAINK